MSVSHVAFIENIMMTIGSLVDKEGRLEEVHVGSISCRTCDVLCDGEHIGSKGSK